MPWSYSHMSGRHYHHPWDGDSDPQRCPTCGASEEDGEGTAWGREWPTDIWSPIIVPFGRCEACGWSCEACPDIEDAIERSGDYE